MKPLLRISSLLSFFLVVSSCKYDTQRQLSGTDKSQIVNTAKLIPIDFNDSNYDVAGHYAVDTITKDGWSIKYFVKDDSTRYDDIYIEWAKGNLKGLYKGESLLRYRRYFIPEYIGENSKFLFFEHGCATDCGAILTFSKDSAVAKDYIRVIDYNIPNGQIAYVTDKGAEDERPFQISVVDLLRNQEHLVQFENLCMPVAYKEQCIDTVIFGKDQVLVKANLTINNYYRDKEFVEEKVVFLK